jgi:hypothetical protein
MTIATHPSSHIFEQNDFRLSEQYCQLRAMDVGVVVIDGFVTGESADLARTKREPTGF